MGHNSNLPVLATRRNNVCQKSNCRQQEDPRQRIPPLLNQRIPKGNRQIPTTRMHVPIEENFLLWTTPRQRMALPVRVATQPDQQRL